MLNHKNYIFLIISFLFIFSLHGQVNDSLNTERPKIGLVLSGGGARGLAHIGILKMIDSLLIPVDYIAGTSMGGIVGAFYATGYSANEIEKMVREVDWNEMFTDRPQRKDLPYLQKKDDGKYGIELGMKGFTPTIPGGLIEGQKIHLLFSSLTASARIGNDFSELPVPYKCVAVDLVTGREVILEKGSLPKAMRATMAIPTVFSPVEWGDSLLIDGGVLNNFPADVVKEMGADIIIGVNAGSPLKERNELKDIISLLEQTMILTDFHKQQENTKLCDLVIIPKLPGLSTGDFDKRSVEKIIALGDKAAFQNINNLVSLKEKFLKDTDYDNSYTKKLHSKGNHTIPQIFSFNVKGNEKIPFNFIYNHLGIKPGSPYNKNLLKERIDQLYALGYFDQISYEIEKKDENNIRLLLNVKEKPMRKLRLGYKFDNFYEFVGLIGFQGTNIPFSGFRIESSMEFAGYFKFDYSISYPSRQLNLPIIPYIRFSTKDIPVDIYHLDNGEVISTYADRATATGIGIGIRFGNVGMLEAEYNYEYINITPKIFSTNPLEFPSFKDDLRKVCINYNIDMLDDVILPRNGLKLQLKYEASSKTLQSEINYQKYQIQGDFYNEFVREHCIHLQGFYTNHIDGLPLYKNTFLGGPNSFVGVEYGQLEGYRIGYGRIDYRYEHRKDIFLKLIGNIGFSETDISFNSNDKTFLFGYGIGVKFLSIIGPFELIYSRGSRSFNRNDSFASRFYFTAGFYF